MPNQPIIAAPIAAGDVVVAGRDVGDERARACRTAPRRTASSCLSMLTLILCIGTWPGPSIITWQPLSQAILVSSPSVSSSANCAASLASAMRAGAQAVAEREATRRSLRMISQISSKRS